MRSLRLTISIWVTFSGLCSASGAELFLGPVPVQFIAAGESRTLDLHRFYQPEAAAQLQFGRADKLETSYDHASLQLRITADRAARGLIDLPFTVKSGDKTRRGVITLAIRSPNRHEFVFRPTKKANKVAVAGSFNGWSKEATPLQADEKGVFRAAFSLAPGSYTYKYVVDGEWTADTENPAQEADGFGGRNAALKVEGEGKEPAGLTIYADRFKDGSLIVKAAGPGEIGSCSAVAELLNGEVQLQKATLQPRELALATKDLPEGSWLRVVVADKSGRASNVIRCRSGKTTEFRWQDAIMYYALTDRFRDGDKSNDHPVENPDVKAQANFHGGDWRGIEEKIEDGYFQELGVNTIWIAPLNQNPEVAYREYPEPHRWYTGYHGYWPVSPTEVEPHFGDAAALQSLIKTAHQHGLKVIADLVLHHVHTEHPWWKEHRDWFGSLELPDGTKSLRRWDDYQFTTWFEPYLPTFDFGNAEAVAALIDNSAWWANQYELDGFRLDAVKHIPTDFWWKFRRALRDKVEAKSQRRLYLVGETFKDRAGIDSFVGPNMLDGQFDFPLYDSIKDCFGEEKSGLDELEASLRASEEAYGKESLMSPLIGNHDKGRFMAYADDDLPDARNRKEEEVGWSTPPEVDHPESYAKIELAQAFLLSVDGVPMIYYGDEIGMTGAGDPDNRRDMRFGEELSDTEKGVLQNFSALTEIRKRHPALRNGSRRTLVAEKDLFAFVRAQLEDRVLCVFNRSSQAVEREFIVGPELADGRCKDELSGALTTIKEGRITVKMGPRSAAFFVSER